ncbi:unnamed protein product, partial [Closterium sp. NIES-53]
WLTRDAAARLAVRNHLPLAECAQFGQHKTAKALYDAVVTRYSSPATAALGRLILPYLFPELSAFATVDELITHLRTSDTRYRAALTVEFLDKNLPPMYITLYSVVTCLPDSLRAVRDHFLALDPTYLTVDLLEKHLLAAETSAVDVSPSSSLPTTSPIPSPSSSTTLSHPAIILHHRLGHPNFAALRTTVTSHLLHSLPPTLPPLPSSPAPPCPLCIHGKLKQSPHHSHPTFAAAPIDLVHMDLRGPYPIRSRQGHWNMLVLVDNHSRYSTVFFLHTKDQVLAVVINWAEQCRNHFKRPIGRLHSDGGGEFINNTLATFCKFHGIQQTSTLPHSPQQNGIVESCIREITKIARCLIAHASTPPSLSTYALLHAALLLNLRSHPQHPSSSPTEFWSKAKPDAVGLCVWGCKSFVFIPPVDCSHAAGKLAHVPWSACAPSPLSLLHSLSPFTATARPAAAAAVAGSSAGTAAVAAAGAAAAAAAAAGSAAGAAAAAAGSAATAAAAKSAAGAAAAPPGAAAAAAAAAAPAPAAPAAAAAPSNFPLLPFPPPSHAHSLPGQNHWSPSSHLHSAP